MNKCQKYIIFCLFLLWLLIVLGDKLLWAFFGGFLATFGSMTLAVMWSMSMQRKGWWEDEPFENKFCGNGYCCCPPYKKDILS